MKIYNGELSLISKGDNDIPSIVLFLNNHPEILSLNLTLSKITQVGINMLAQLKNITSLNISHNGLEGTINWEGLINLTSLNVDYNYLKDEGAKALVTLTNLKSLSVRMNFISDNGIKALACLPNLTTINVGDNVFKNIGAMALASSQAHVIALSKFPYCIKEKEKQILAERDPIKRANFGKTVGIKTEVPSLLRIALFNIKKNNIDHTMLLNGEKIDILPDELIEKLGQDKI